MSKFSAIDVNISDARVTVGIDEWPYTLQKAISEGGDYTLRLSNGDTFRFNEANFSSKHWVRLEEVHNGNGFNYTKGVDIRVSEILWISEAPKTSN